MRVMPDSHSQHGMDH